MEKNYHSIMGVNKGEEVHCKHCGAFLFGIESDCKYYVTKCKKCGVINRGSTSQVFKPKKKNEK